MRKRIELFGSEGSRRGAIFVSWKSCALDVLPLEVGLTHGSGTSLFLRFVNGSYYFRESGYFTEHSLGKWSALSLEPQGGGGPPFRR